MEGYRAGGGTWLGRTEFWYVTGDTFNDQHPQGITVLLSTALWSVSTLYGSPLLAASSPGSPKPRNLAP